MQRPSVLHPAVRSTALLVRPTRALCFTGVDQTSGQAHFHRFGLADGVGQALGAAHAGQDAEFDFRLTEARIIRSEDEVAHQCQFAAAAQSKTCHGGDERGSPGGYAITVAEQVVQIDLGILQLSHFLDIRPRRKRFAGAGQHNAANVTVGVKIIQRMVRIR